MSEGNKRGRHADKKEIKKYETDRDIEKQRYRKTEKEINKKKFNLFDQLIENARRER